MKGHDLYRSPSVGAGRRPGSNPMAETLQAVLTLVLVVFALLVHAGCATMCPKCRYHGRMVRRAYVEPGGIVVPGLECPRCRYLRKQ